ncbi:pyocin activator PrtN family protein [Christiangramia sp. OXR-203]|uniref:pyocin activator PrtN family protein n=1 Tax=Christiangramia sp. OXR-203 TaxID=3100176 RepID=UPI003A0FDFD7
MMQRLLQLELYLMRRLEISRMAGIPIHLRSHLDFQASVLLNLSWKQTKQLQRGWRHTRKIFLQYWITWKIVFSLWMLPCLMRVFTTTLVQIKQISLIHYSFLSKRLLQEQGSCSQISLPMLRMEMSGLVKLPSEVNL